MNACETRQLSDFLCARLNCPVLLNMASISNTPNASNNTFAKIRSKFVLKDSKSNCSDIVPFRVSYFENIRPKWFNNLPLKILLNIFQYFNEEELRKCIIPVSTYIYLF